VKRGEHQTQISWPQAAVAGIFDEIFGIVKVREIVLQRE
jgi:hypothetical protein